MVTKTFYSFSVFRTLISVEKVSYHLRHYFHEKETSLAPAGKGVVEHTLLCLPEEKGPIKRKNAWVCHSSSLCLPGGISHCTPVVPAGGYMLRLGARTDAFKVIDLWVEGQKGPQVQGAFFTIVCWNLCTQAVIGPSFSY